MTASTDEQREELARLRPDVLRVVAGLVANAELVGSVSSLADPGDGKTHADTFASWALDIVRAVDRVCGIGADDE